MRATHKDFLKIIGTFLDQPVSSRLLLFFKSERIIFYNDNSFILISRVRQEITGTFYLQGHNVILMHRHQNKQGDFLLHVIKESIFKFFHTEKQESILN